MQVKPPILILLLSATALTSPALAQDAPRVSAAPLLSFRAAEPSDTATPTVPKPIWRTPGPGASGAASSDAAITLPTAEAVRLLQTLADAPTAAAVVDAPVRVTDTARPALPSGSPAGLSPAALGPSSADSARPGAANGTPTPPARPLALAEIGAPAAATPAPAASGTAATPGPIAAPRGDSRFQLPSWLEGLGLSLLLAAAAFVLFRSALAFLNRPLEVWAVGEDLDAGQDAAASSDAKPTPLRLEQGEPAPEGLAALAEADPAMPGPATTPKDEDLGAEAEVDGALPGPEAVGPGVATPTPAGGQRPLGWLALGETATVAGRTLSGLVYVGSATAADDAAPASIDPALPAAPPGAEAAAVPHWPSYAALDPGTRGAYLDWLQAGRDGAEAAPGFVLLYFYGLEHRYFAEAADNDERWLLIDEVERLKEVYSHHGPVRRYLQAFLDLAPLLLSEGAMAATEPAVLAAGLPTPLLVSLGRKVAAGTPIDADDLLAWHLANHRTALPLSLVQALPEFQAMVRHLFDAEFPNGLMLRQPKRDLDLVYRAASGRFQTPLTPIIGTVPDVSHQPRPQRVAARLAKTAAKALEPFARLVTAIPDARQTLAGWLLLPAAIRPARAPAALVGLEAAVTHSLTRAAPQPAGDLAATLLGAAPDTIDRTTLRLLAAALRPLGAGIVPDPDLGAPVLAPEDPVVLYPLPADADAPGLSPALREGLTILALGWVAARNAGTGAADPRALTQLSAAFEPVDEARFAAYALFFTAVPPDLAALRAAAAGKPPADRLAVVRLALAAATAHGSFGPLDHASAAALCDALDVDLDAALSGLETADTPPADGVVPLDAFRAGPRPAVARARGGAMAEAVAPMAVPGAWHAAAEPLRLDQSAVALELETLVDIDADRILDLLLPAEVAPKGAKALVHPLAALDLPQARLATALLDRPDWTAADLERLADEQGVRPEAALATLNAWSRDRYGAPLVAEAEPHVVTPVVAAYLAGAGAAFRTAQSLS